MIATRIFKRCSFSDLQKKEKYLSCHATNECSGNERYVMRMSRIQETFPEVVFFCYRMPKKLAETNF